MTTGPPCVSPILQFLERHAEFNVGSFAARCGVSRVTISRVARAKQKPLYETGIKIQTGTDKEVTVQSLMDHYACVHEGGDNEK